MKKLVLEFSPLMAILLILAVVMPVGITILPASPAMAVDNCFAGVGPQTAGSLALYTITCDTTVVLTTGAGDTITIVFPALTVIPSNVDVTVNGATPSLVTIAGTTVTLRVSANVPVGPVSILFNGTNKITNPTAAGTKTLTVRTSQEPTPVTSGPYTITTGPVSSLVIVQQPTDSYTGWTITPAVTVRARDSYTNLISGLSVYLAFNGTGTITGTTPKLTDG
jgi:hypothetical protein